MSIADILPEFVIYHMNCDDGFCAAWLHRRHSPRLGEYVPAQYGDPPPDVRDRDVLIFDFSYRRVDLERMHREANLLRVFDHHKTAEKELEGLDYCQVDMDKCGARMALEYLCGESADDNWLVDYIGNRDVWGSQLPNNELVRAGLSSYRRDFKVWDRIFERGPAALGRQGRHILRYQKRLVKAAVENHSWMSIGGHIVPVVSNTIASLNSDIVGTLAEIEGVPFAAGFFVLPTGQVVYNLRSRGEFDVSKVAKKHGGGGHRNAACFKAPSVFLSTASRRTPQEVENEPQRVPRQEPSALL